MFSKVVADCGLFVCDVMLQSFISFRTCNCCAGIVLVAGAGAVLVASSAAWGDVSKLDAPMQADSCLPL